MTLWFIERSWAGTGGWEKVGWGGFGELRIELDHGDHELGEGGCFGMTPVLPGLLGFEILAPSREGRPSIDILQACLCEWG